MTKLRGPLNIEIHQLPDQGITITEDREATSFHELVKVMNRDKVEFTSPIGIDLWIAAEKDMIRVKGRVAFTLRMVCSRCASVLDGNLDRSFTLRYSRQIPKDVHDPGQEGIELTAEQIGLAYYEGDRIDLKDAIQEQVILALPFKPVCREDCKGLCPQCGVDRNQETCKCDQQKPSGPFDVLKGLKLS